MRPERRFLLLCSAVACASLIGAVLPVPAILRTLIALPLVFVLPGAAMLRALDLRFTPYAHAPIAVGLSMAITVLGGLALNWLGGLTSFGWTLWLGSVSILAAVAALRNASTGGRRPLPAMRLRHGAMLAAAAAVLMLTFHSTARAITAYRPFPHTSFWMLPLAQASEVYMIGIKNDEGRPETYAVQLMVAQRITGQWQDLILASGQTVTFPVMVQPGAAAQAWLYRAEQPQAIYRRVTVAGNNDSDGASGSDAPDQEQ